MPSETLNPNTILWTGGGSTGPIGLYAQAPKLTIQGAGATVSEKLLGICIMTYDQGGCHPFLQGGYGNIGGCGLMWPGYTGGTFASPLYADLVAYKPKFIRYMADNHFPWRMAVSADADIAARPCHMPTPENVASGVTDYSGSHTGVTTLWFGPREMGKLVKKLREEEGLNVDVLVCMPYTFRHWITAPVGFWGADANYVTDTGGYNKEAGGYDSYVKDAELGTLAQYLANYVEFCNAPSPASLAGMTAGEYGTSMGWEPTAYGWFVPSTTTGPGHQSPGHNLTLAATSGVPDIDDIDSWGPYTANPTLRYTAGDYYKMPPGNAVFRCKIDHTRYGAVCHTATGATIASEFIPGRTNLWWRYWDWITKDEVYAEGESTHASSPSSWKAHESAPDGYFAWLRHYYGDTLPYNFKYWQFGNESSRYISADAMSKAIPVVWNAITGAYAGAVDDVQLSFYLSDRDPYGSAKKNYLDVGNTGSYNGAIDAASVVGVHPYIMMHPIGGQLFGDEQNYLRQVQKAYGLYSANWGVAYAPRYETGDIIREAEDTGRFYQCIKAFNPGWGEADYRYPYVGNYPAIRPGVDTGWEEYWERVGTLPKGYVMSRSASPYRLYYRCKVEHTCGTAADYDYSTSDKWPTSGVSYQDYWENCTNITYRTESDYRQAKTIPTYVETLMAFLADLNVPFIADEWNTIPTYVFTGLYNTYLMHSINSALSSAKLVHDMARMDPDIALAASLFYWADVAWFSTTWGRMVLYQDAWGGSAPTKRASTPKYYLGKMYNTLLTGTLLGIEQEQALPDNLDIIATYTPGYIRIFCLNFHTKLPTKIRMRIPGYTATGDATVYCLKGAHPEATNYYAISGGDTYTTKTEVQDPMDTSSEVTIELPEFVFTFEPNSATVISIPV